MAGAQVTAATTPAATPGMPSNAYYPARFDVTGLTAATKYYYQARVNGQPSGPVQSLTTFPAAGQPAASFRFVFGSCTVPPSLGPSSVPPAYKAIWPDRVHQAIAAENPLFFMHIGDMDYSDIDQDDIRMQRTRNSRAYRDNPDVAVLLGKCPIVYMWDDHDAGANDCELGQTYKSLATFEAIARNGRAVVRETTPIYPTVQTGLGETDISHNILSQVFDVGRTRFLVPDLRSQRRISAATCLGQNLGNGDYWDQRSWLIAQMQAASAAGIKYLFLVITSTWTGGTYSGFGDVFTAERKVLCDAIQGLDLEVTLLVGDAHESAVDDGTNTGSFSTDGLARFPQIMSSPLSNQGTGTIAGPFSWNSLIKRVQNNSSVYCVVDVVDDGTKVTWTATLKGNPIDPVTFSATTYHTVTSTDVTPAIGFTTGNTFLSPAGAPLPLPIRKSWFGPVGGADVDYSSTDGDTGTVHFKPNNSGGVITLPAKASGQSVTVTLANPKRSVLASPSVLTINFLTGQQETFDLVNSMTVQPTNARISAIDTLISSMKSAGAWALLDRFYVLAAHDRQAARLNWKKPSVGALIEVNAPIWTVDRGYAGDGISAYLNPSYVLTSAAETYNYALNSGHIGGWSRTESVDAAPFGGSGDATIGARANASNNVQGKINGPGLISGTVTTSIGDFVASRTASANFSVYAQGSAAVSNFASDSSTATMTKDAFYIMRRVTNYTARQLAMMHWGGGLTASQVQSLYNAKLSFLQSVGAA